MGKKKLTLTKKIMEQNKLTPKQIKYIKDKKNKQLQDQQLIKKIKSWNITDKKNLQQKKKCLIF